MAALTEEDKTTKTTLQCATLAFERAVAIGREREMKLRAKKHPAAYGGCWGLNPHFWDPPHTTAIMLHADYEAAKAKWENEEKTKAEAKKSVHSEPEPEIDDDGDLSMTPFD